MVSANQAERFPHLCKTEQSIGYWSDRNHAAERAFLSTDNQPSPGSAVCLCRSFRLQRRLKAMNEELVCMADIQNKIYEAGLFRPEEKVVLATKGCVLLEYFTGKTYSYRMVDI